MFEVYRIKCKTKEIAWKKAKEMAMNEAELVSEEYECEIALSLIKEENKISLHYTYDDEYCYYEVIEL